jgi:hypothetical protein
MAEPVDDEFDPYELHFQREPRRGAGVFVIAVRSPDGRGGEPIAESVRARVRSAGRAVESIVIDLGETSTGDLERAVNATSMPLVVITSAAAPWTDAHLKPLLNAIDKADHVFGCRPLPLGGRLRRWLANRPARWIFGVPVADIHSPCRIHRAEALRAIPFQSRSAFLDVEIPAKATFLGHLIDEVAIPPLEGIRWNSARADRRLVARHPLFVRPSIPAEDSEGEEESAAGPDAQNEQCRPDLADARPLEDHGA